MRLLLAALVTVLAVHPLAAQEPPRIAFTAAGPGSAFLPYAEGIARVIEGAGAARIEVRRTGGSNDNLRAVEADAAAIGTVFLGSAHAAVTGTGFAQGAPMRNLTALFPMYETAFMTAALRSSGITAFAGLDGRRVGTGPARGPAEDFFRMAAEAAGIRPVIVSGDPAALVRQLLAGEIDALWQGASVPIPSLTQVADAADAVLFGLPPAVVEAMRARSPVLVPATVPPGTYRGQTAALASVAAWNFVIAHRDMPEPLAYALTRAVLGAADLATVVGPAARGTRAEFARANGVLPFHPGARRALRELGVEVP